MEDMTDSLLVLPFLIIFTAALAAALFGLPQLSRKSAQLDFGSSTSDLIRIAIVVPA
jgi:hypothetical protein